MEKVNGLAQKIMGYARDTILVNLRFLDVAVSALTPGPKEGIGGFASDGSRIYYDPVFLLKKYQEEKDIVIFRTRKELDDYLKSISGDTERAAK